MSTFTKLPEYYGKGREPIWSQFNRAQNERKSGLWKPDPKLKLSSNPFERFGWKKTPVNPYKWKKHQQPVTKFKKQLGSERNKKIVYKKLKRPYTVVNNRARGGVKPRVDLTVDKEVEELRTMLAKTKAQQLRLRAERNLFTKKYS